MLYVYLIHVLRKVRMTRWVRGRQYPNVSRREGAAAPVLWTLSVKLNIIYAS